MKFECWLNVQGKKSQFGGVAQNGLKLYMKKPATAAGVTIRLDFDIPDALFVKPTITAKVHVPDMSKSLTEIMADVSGPLEDMMTETLGLKIELSIADPDP